MHFNSGYIFFDHSYSHLRCSVDLVDEDAVALSWRYKAILHSVLGCVHVCMYVLMHVFYEHGYFCVVMCHVYVACMIWSYVEVWLHGYALYCFVNVLLCVSMSVVSLSCCCRRGIS